MNIIPFTRELIPEAAALFARNFTRARQASPILPERMENPACTADFLGSLLENSAASSGATAGAVAAVEGGSLVGYLGWWLIDGFRDTPRKAAYCPVWAHAVVEGQEGAPRWRVYRALYRAAAAAWLAEKCTTHVVTLLAHEEATREIWYWNGFGLGVVDAVRSLDPLGVQPPAGYTLRKADPRAFPSDLEDLAEIEAEHWRHYAEPPTLMTAGSANNAEEFAQLLENPQNCVWMAWKGSDLAGYLRFEHYGHGASVIVRDEGTMANTGAYVRPAHRGQGIAPALLDAALADFRARGLARCAVDFESFNPEAATFWPKYFDPVCFSVFRVPERE